MSTTERIRIIRLLEKIEKDPAHAKAVGITVITLKQSKKLSEICTAAEGR